MSSMETNEILLIVLLILAAINIAISLINKTGAEVKSKIDGLSSMMSAFGITLERTEKSIKDEFQRSRAEFNDTSKLNRDELTNSLNSFSEQYSKSVKELNELLTNKFTVMTDQQREFNKNTNDENRTNREELSKSLESFEAKFIEMTKELNELLRQKFNDFSERQTEVNKQATESVKEVKLSVENQLKEIREDNKTQLDAMRKTVDEKLQKTLNERLSQSFETVGKQLLSVQQGLGEMKTLATDVGGLKKVLSNVKLRGGIGEVQLEMLLEQILAPEQYEANVKTKKSSSDLVEFAIKFPGGDDSTVWLPIDAKFPKDIYEQLLESYEQGDSEVIKIARKKMETTIKKMAKDISDKYLDPPYTTDFGIMFLPFESIYAEVTRNSELLESLRHDYNITVAGPTNLAVILNGFYMGFKTLAIEKRSSEVWQVLGSVKREFDNFGGMMDKAQKNIQTGLNQLDDVMGVRTRAIQRKLKNVETLTDAASKTPPPELEKTSLTIEGSEK
ncbi:DNA recombination protein RmuC [hydrothermal vent metagenome]|uniref:DNA recombination protein RmuC n=1 Tax=hydrothermal vent metagenome TaxID=652676 RepID=A0A3B0WDF8_9ZZZZ